MKRYVVVQVEHECAEQEISPDEHAIEMRVVYQIGVDEAWELIVNGEYRRPIQYCPFCGQELAKGADDAE